MKSIICIILHLVVHNPFLPCKLSVETQIIVTDGRACSFGSAVTFWVSAACPQAVFRPPSLRSTDDTVSVGRHGLAAPNTKTRISGHGE